GHRHRVLREPAPGRVRAAHGLVADPGVLRRPGGGGAGSGGDAADRRGEPDRLFDRLAPGCGGVRLVARPRGRLPLGAVRVPKAGSTAVDSGVCVPLAFRGRAAGVAARRWPVSREDGGDGGESAADLWAPGGGACLRRPRAAARGDAVTCQARTWVRAAAGG